MGLLMGCSASDHTAQKKSAPLILAHRASSGLWIQNSRHGVKKTIELYQQHPQKFHGIEVDIALTKDKIPVLSHDPWVHKRLCNRKDGKPMQERLIKDSLFADLQKEFSCGGIIDNDFPRAQTHAESIMSLSEFITMVKNVPDLIVYLDVKVQPPLTAPANEFAQAIFSQWATAQATNPLYVEGSDKQIIKEYQTHSSTPFIAVLSYPAFFANENALFKGGWAAIISRIQPKKSLNMVQAAKAQAIAVPVAVNHQNMQQRLQEFDKKVIVFTPNSQKDIRQACLSGVDIIITDFPNKGPCAQKQAPQTN